MLFVLLCQEVEKEGFDIDEGEFVVEMCVRDQLFFL